MLCTVKYYRYDDETTAFLSGALLLFLHRRRQLHSLYTTLLLPKKFCKTVFLVQNSRGFLHCTTCVSQCEMRHHVVAFKGKHKGHILCNCCVLMKAAAETMTCAVPYILQSTVSLHVSPAAAVPYYTTTSRHWQNRTLFQNCSCCCSLSKRDPGQKKQQKFARLANTRGNKLQG